MTKKVRDWIFILFIALFLVMTIGISLYASGYRFNLGWPLKFNRLLQKTGMLAVATEPTGAVVYLNDKPQKDLSIKPWKKNYLLTPAKIKNLLPGEYELRLEQTGYWPYKQKIRINSGETTFIEDVNLFRENLPLLVLAAPKDNLKISPDKKNIYLESAKKIITLKTELVRSLSLPENVSAMWLRSGKLLAVGTIFDPVRENNDINYTNLIGAEATNWYFEEATGRLYYQNKDTINRLEANSKTSTSLISGNHYLAYEPRQDKLFTITKRENKINLQVYSLKNYQRESEWTLPNSGRYSIIKEITKQLAVYDDLNKTLYLFTPTKLDTGPTIIRNIKNWTIVNDQSMIYANDFEIYFFNFSNSRADLITRRSEQINGIIWNAAKNYLIFSGLTTLNVLDFKNLTTTLLFKAEDLASPVLDDRNNNLYFWARVGQQEGIYKIIMQ